MKPAYLATVRFLEGRPAGATVSDVAQASNCSVSLANKRLSELRKVGRIDFIGSTSRYGRWAAPQHYATVRTEVAGRRQHQLASATAESIARRRRREAAALACEEIRDFERPPQQRVISAASAPPLEHRGPCSVFEWAGQA